MRTQKHKKEMKKLFFVAGAVLALASCTTITKTASDVDVPSSLYSATVADLKVSPERVTYTIKPSKALQRGGLANVKKAVESEALTQNGNADVLVEPEYIIAQKRGLFKRSITSITITGRPAKYTNFHSLNDSVWCNPVFRSDYKNSVKSSTGLFNRH